MHFHNRGDEIKRFTKPWFRLASIFLAAATFLSPLTASAISFNDFEKESREQQNSMLLRFVDAAIAKQKAVNSARADDITTYFYHIPDGGKVPPGWKDFFTEFKLIKELGKEGKLNLDKIQVEELVEDVIDQKFPLPSTRQPAGSNAPAQPSLSSTPSPSAKP